MPKESSERIIDWPFQPATNRGGTTAITPGGGGGGGASNLDALTDVTLNALVNGQVLSYNAGSGQWVNATNSASVPNPHGLSSSYHNGLLVWSKIDFTGSSLGDLATRSHSLLTGIGPNDHHFQQHVLATGTALGADHTISGAAAGQVLRASDATHAALTTLHHTDLDTILPDQHHTRAHDIITGDPSGPVHTVVGADFTVVGVHPANTVALLPTSSAPGAAVAILKTDSNGGVQLDTNLFYVDGANNWIGVNRTPSGATLDVIAAANADHTQRLKMKSGQTGRLWRIEDLTGNELIVLDSVGNLQSGQPGFVSGLTGWRISPVGNAEFNNIWARGELHATVFVKDEVHATGGTLLVATAGTLHDDAVIDSTLVDDDVLVVKSTPVGTGVPLQILTTSGAFTGTQLHVKFIGNFINVNDPPSGPGFYFQPGDVIRSKTEVPTGVTDFWLEVQNATQNSGYSTYSVVKRSGTDGTLPKGSALVSYGKQGNGRILMTSDLNYAPYLDVFTVGPNVWTGAAGAVLPRVRLGRLDGIGLPGVSGVEQYGLIAGKDLSDANQGYFIASNLGISLYKADIRLNNGVSDTGLWTADGNLKIGSNIGALATTGFQIYTTGGRAGDVVIGNEATGNYLRWTQASGILQVVGSLLVSDPGTTVTLAYVNSQDSYYDTQAQGYGSTAQTNAQSYSDAHRITGVSAVFTSASATTIAWASFTASMAGGGGRTIAPGSATIAARTFLYVDISLAGTLTLTPTPAIGALNAVNRILIAVADPATNASSAASVTVVVGSTYISGGNIFTGSIVADNIAAGAITAGKIESAVITSINTAQTTANTANGAAGAAQSTANTANSTANSALTAANNAQSSADANLTYSESRRVVGVSGTWTVVDGTHITWSGLQVKFANLTARTITAQTNYLLTTPNLPNSTRHYLYIDVTDATPVLLDATSIGALGTFHALIATVDTGVAKASISIVAGSTYISGDNILTGSIISSNIASRTIQADRLVANSITANELAADSVTASEINVTNLAAVSTLTGVLTIDTTGNIHSSGKTAYANATAGFFLGWTGSVYGFDIGNATNYLRWDGAALALKTATPLDLTGDGSNNIFVFHSPAGHAGSMQFDVGGDLSFRWNQPVVADRFTAANLMTINYATGLNNGDVLKLVISGVSNAGSDVFHYDRSGPGSLLSYSGDFSAAGSLFGNVLIGAQSGGIALRLLNKHTPNHLDGGNQGEFCWDDDYFYIYIGSPNNRWHRVQHLGW